MDKFERLVRDAGAAVRLSTVVDKVGEVYRTMHVHSVSERMSVSLNERASECERV